MQCLALSTKPIRGYKPYCLSLVNLLDTSYIYTTDFFPDLFPEFDRGLSFWRRQTFLLLDMSDTIPCADLKRMHLLYVSISSISQVVGNVISSVQWGPEIDCILSNMGAVWDSNHPCPAFSARQTCCEIELTPVQTQAYPPPTLSSCNLDQNLWST